MEISNMDELKQYIENVVTVTDKTLDEILPKGDDRPRSIHELMRYSTFAGGKRIRPCLMMAANEACGAAFGNRNVALAGAAIEMLHTFSLIHDDLPCMDDDDFRRGKPTAHKAFGEALAVLGGDALCIYAYETLAQVGRIDVIHQMSQALGTQGMLGGQVVDIESEGKTVTKDTVDYIHMHKTAALIRVSVVIGGMLAGASEKELERLGRYGNNIGLAFQVVDDILDEESTTEVLGKDIGSDRERGKATYPALIGLEKSKEVAKELIENAHKDIEFLGEKGKILKLLADYVRLRVS